MVIYLQYKFVLQYLKILSVVVCIRRDNIRTREGYPQSEPRRVITRTPSPIQSEIVQFDRQILEKTKKELESGLNDANTA